MKFNGLIAAAVVCSGVMFGDLPCWADPVTFSLTNPNQSGTVGSFLTFTGSLTNVTEPTATIMSSNFNGLSLTLTFDDTPFVIDFLGQNITGGTTLGPLPFFTVTIEDGTAPGIYEGVMSVMFDSAGGIGQETNFETFSVTVPPIPEPTTLSLLGLGLAGIATMRSAKKRS